MAAAARITRHWCRVGLAAVFAIGFAQAGHAATLQVLAPSGALPAIRALADVYTRQTGTTVEISGGAVGQVARKFDAGAPCDLLVLPPSDLAALAADGRVAPASVAPLERVHIGMGIRSGLAHPDISTEAGFRAALLAANGVVYTKPDPVHGSLQASIIAAMMARPDFAGVHGVTTGGSKDEAVQQQWDMMLTLVSELPPVKPLPGVEFVGPVPDSLHAYIDFAAAIPVKAASGTAAADFLRFLKSPQSMEAWHAHGAEPQ